MKKLFLVLLLIGMQLCCYLAQAADTVHQEGSFHGAHVHGHAMMMIAAEKNALEITIESPAANLIGFEHEASTPEQKGMIKRVKEKLKSAKGMFEFHGVDCVPVNITIDMAAVSDHAAEHEGDHADHAEHVHKEAEDKAAHNDVLANYAFTCASTDSAQLTAITVHLLKHFKAIEKLQVQWVTNTKQGVAVLTESANTIHLK
jgi:hypothetical protein